jgi:hypothetical protein
MRAFIKVTAVMLAAFLIVGCGGGPQTMQSTSTGDVPEWYTAVPVDPNFLFAANTAVSQDMQISVDKAVQAARVEIGRQVETKVNGLQKRFEEETGVGQDAQLLQQYSAASKTIVSSSLTGSRVRTQKQVKDGNMWRSYVLVEYPIGDANKALLEAIKKNNEMYTRFRAAEAFKELDTDVQKYEEWKKQQGK